MFAKAYYGAPAATGNKLKSSVVYFDIRINSPYKDIILLQGSPLEMEPYPLSGKLVFSLSDDITVKRVSLKFSGIFKLEFLQMGRYKDTGKLASIVKEKKIIFECKWDNLLVSPQGKITIGADNVYNERYNNNGTGALGRTFSSSSTGLNKLIKKGTFYSSSVLDLPVNGATGTPYEHMEDELKSLSSSTSINFNLQKGNYELPFKIMLPSEIPETIEGLQSGSILYSFEGHIERRKKSGMPIIIRDETDYSNSNPKSANVKTYSYRYHKYFRVFRTLSSDNFAMQEEMKVGNSWPDKLQYEVSIPSRAIPVGGITPISIKIFPFQKHYILEKIGVTLIQFYSMKDSSGQLYNDEVVALKQSMTDFEGFIKINERTGSLIDKVEIDSMIKMPDDLKKATQDCDIIGEIIRIRHKLAIQIVMKRLASDGTTKMVEIKATIPILLFISPQVTLKGRYVVLDNNSGRIHFRSGKFVTLFDNNNSNNLMTEAVVNNTNPIFVDNTPPPNYQERTKDRLLQYSTTPLPYEQFTNTDIIDQLITNNNTEQDRITNEIEDENNREGTTNNIMPLNSVPTYDQTMDETTIGANNTVRNFYVPAGPHASGISNSTTVNANVPGSTANGNVDGNHNINTFMNSSNEEDETNFNLQTSTDNSETLVDSSNIIREEFAPSYSD
ncbi:hypothetical protein Kpol_472p9 [Vanderwaltozyma polyspora DSM 70294]|uniref:Arrestin C-terminal-like domain-containing protein n=1 Tax=Vanderwaltozyma polyspora (strain ATCC 22028 / DSM 70294 / BCRC 21397 / CBS 2163 / NBRC 10782 / NRRL Y-8283 / UCD 57-17) TaxID=436907 RepID=A7TQH7_VANPO|nr:uncharacterized protein Kpol_472p9 [Vanderwaltozyma polyspora DSM 70294]EDO15478.1 hypothetical protein Kpol_472p9 [Vanderwaltozyma polyspora DSM 70294]